ncbi:uncharacterized protein N0V89_001821 [Didymosphaeria variabile]|uniref:Xylanolytic transcriptional activator regulatory domain-containing protein n=1 Tax=Didymosphaeria variabile TaxID=1932322 RepID=A0A9W9CCZ1_9PLEO|nr:uncharacterized protein N0V89_001821 [Didymosphaeria variabile]KAJ4357246.1 hypothetical protein N0V89_001821 [Didymosphaeria variabile]
MSTAAAGPANDANRPCIFPEKPQQVLISKETLERLQREAARAGSNPEASSARENSDSTWTAIPTEGHATRHDSTLIARYHQGEPTVENEGSSTTPTSQLDIDQPPESRYGSRAVSVLDESDRNQPIINPLVSGQSSYAAVNTGQALLLGSSSNWSFGRRALALVHNAVFASPLVESDLHYDGSTYDLGWDGRRTALNVTLPALPTVDHALFLINTVKFHCGQLFHVFDNEIFMRHFNAFHAKGADASACPELWYIHYLIVLAIGKSLIGQAMRTAIAFGFHTDMPLHQHSPNIIERCRQIWWTVYILDSHMSALMGVPRTINERDISTQLPRFNHSAYRTRALHIHIQLANIEGSIQQKAVYSREGRTGINFLNSIKNALKALAAINDERTSSFPLGLDDSENGISRLSAHLHLFHHHVGKIHSSRPEPLLTVTTNQCIILNTKPLLFSFLQKRVEALRPIRIPSSGGVRSLLRVCVGSARQTTKILAALQSQTLIDTFVPFDLESTWSAALVLLIASVVDPSLVHDTASSLKITFDVLNDMSAVGNSVATSRRAELERLKHTLKALENMGQQAPIHTSPPAAASDEPLAMATMNPNHPGTVRSGYSDIEYMSAHSWDMEDVLNSAQLEAVAESMNLNGLDWGWAASALDQLDPSLL